MSLLSALLDLSTGGLARRAYDLEEIEDEPESCPGTEMASCACNGCGRVFHPTWIHHPCPARCGGRLYPR